MRRYLWFAVLLILFAIAGCGRQSAEPIAYTAPTDTTGEETPGNAADTDAAAGPSEDLSAPELGAKRSPVQTVEYYFEQWSSKNWTEMLTVLGMERVTESAFERQFSGLKYVTLISCEEADPPYGWDESWYPDPYDYITVTASFEIEFEPGTAVLSGMENGEYIYSYHLFKSTEDAAWSIGMLGQG